MKNHKKLFSLLLVLCLLLSLSIPALAASYTGDDVKPGLSGIQPGDELTHPDNTDWATLTASWGVRVTFVDWDESELKSEVVPVTDNTPGSSSAPSDPTRSGYTFTGWERHDTTSGTAALNDDGTVTGVNGPGPIVFIAKYTKVNYAVDYSWTGDVPDGVTLPTDDTAYNWHDTPTADTTYTASTSINGALNGVPGTYTFSGWDASDDADLTANGMEGDVTFKGVWTFTPDTYEVTYVVNGDSTYGSPDDAAVPMDTTAYDYNALVTVADDLTTAWTTSDGTATGIPGVWTFTPWDKTDFQITEDTTITGSWTFTPTPVPDPETGKLTISKTVTGDLADKDKNFDFKVVFDAEGSYAYTGSKDGSITSGGVIQLKHGESITITGLPAGTRYTVTESGNSGYTVYVTGDKGIIEANAAATARFTNTRSSVPKTGDDREIGIWITVMAVSLLGMIGILLGMKRRKKHLRSHK